jgi:hypothetical protein
VNFTACNVKRSLPDEKMENTKIEKLKIFKCYGKAFDYRTFRKDLEVELEDEWEKET